MGFCPTLMGQRLQLWSSAPYLWGTTTRSCGAYEVLPHTYGAEPTVAELRPTLMGQNPQFQTSAPHLWGRTHSYGAYEVLPHTYGAQQPALVGPMRFCPTLMGQNPQFRSSAPHLRGRTHNSGPLPHTYGAPLGVLPHTYGAELTLPVLHPTLMGHRQQFRSSAPHLWGRTHTSGPPPHTYGAEPTVLVLRSTLMGHNNPQLWGL